MRAVFGSEFKKKLKIPKIIDDYNNNMNGVDVADQLRSYYSTQKMTQRTWMALFFWLLDTAIINSYRITRTLGLTQEHKEFRLELVWSLVNFANDTGEVQLRDSTKTKKKLKEMKRPKVTKHFKLSDSQLEPGNHLVEWRKNREACRWCSWLANQKKFNMDRKSPNRSNLWCVGCNVPLCCNMDRNCFSEFHNNK